MIYIVCPSCGPWDTQDALPEEEELEETCPNCGKILIWMYQE